MSDDKKDDAAGPPGGESSAPKPAPEPPKSPSTAPVAPPPSPAAVAKPTAPAAPAAPPAAPKPNPMTAPVPSAAVDAIKKRFADEIVEVAYYAGEVTLRLKHRRVEEIWRMLRDDEALRFDFLSNLTAVHWPERPQPFEVVYHLYSISRHHRVNLKIDLAEGEQPPTASSVWATANWHEREVFDLFGIRFHGHPDMTRILMTDEWVGHPLRKDYPLEGKAGDHLQLREVTTAEHVYTFDKAPLKGFGWKKEVEKTGEGRG